MNSWDRTYQMVYCVLVGPLVDMGLFNLLKNIKAINKGRVEFIMYGLLLIATCTFIFGGEPSPSDRYQGVNIINGGAGLMILLVDFSGGITMGHVLSLKSRLLEKGTTR